MAGVVLEVVGAPRQGREVSFLEHRQCPAVGLALFRWLGERLLRRGVHTAKLGTAARRGKRESAAGRAGARVSGEKKLLFFRALEATGGAVLWDDPASRRSEGRTLSARAGPRGRLAGRAGGRA